MTKNKLTLDEALKKLEETKKQNLKSDFLKQYRKSDYFGGSVKKIGEKEHLLINKPATILRSGEVAVPKMYYNYVAKGWMEHSTVMNKEEYEEILKKFKKDVDNTLKK